MNTNKQTSPVNSLHKLTDEQISKLDKTGKLDELIKQGERKTRLTNWKQEPSLNDLKHDFTMAKAHHDVFVSNLVKWDNLYKAPKRPKGKRNESRIVPKLVRKQAEWRSSSLSEPFLATTNLYEVRPLTYEDTDRAKQNSLILNKQFNTQLDKVKLVDNIIRGVVKEGTVIVRLGWEYKEDEITQSVMQYRYMPVQDEQMAQEVMQKYSELSELRQTSPDSYEQVDENLKAGFEMSEEKQTLLIAEAVGEKQQKIKQVVCNKPTAEVCNLKNLYIDPTCQGNLDKAQFIIHSYESSLSELQGKGYYSNLEFIKHHSPTDTFEHDSTNVSGFSFKDKARQKLVVYEYWGYWDIDGTGQTKPIVATWVQDVLIRLDENPFPDKKLPFVVFNYLPEENSVYGIPDAELLEDNQAIVGAVTRGMIDLLGKSANSQTGYSKHFLDGSNKIKFRNGDDYEYNPNTDPRQHIYTHKYPEIPNSAMSIIQIMHNDAEAISGVKAFSGTGITAAHLGDSATAARGVLDAVSKREMSILRRLSDGFIRMGRKIIAMNAEFLSEQEVVRVTNKEFVKVRRDDLAGEFDLILTISTAEADDAKAKELAFMLQTMGNTMGQEVSQLILSEIAELRKMPDLAQKIRDYKPEPDPVAQKLQELEVAKLEAEIALLQAEAQESSAKAQVNSAKVGVEEARAASLQGDADNKALDFMQKDDGTNFQRDIQKQAMQNEQAQQMQQLKNQGVLDKQAQGHNQDVLKQLLGDELQGRQVGRPPLIDSEPMANQPEMSEQLPQDMSMGM